ncbi:FxsA family protein [Rhodovulum strictum]|uniref:FxsA family protein n=1 Tax=Rhodovulum strictum TaxID=58314 RepID=A0A844BB51_9RHOB|nr:FxsA family protein [Rhodovulum strictum]MRH19889.1 FxsA family protein [Rhodovulum strictum]
MWLFLIFLAVPLIEIALFIQVGGLIGLWPTLGIVLLTAAIGTWLIRLQGALALSQLRNSFRELRDPAEPLAHGAMILFAGALLLTPGFFTDAVGFALLMPPVRATAYRWLAKRIVVQGMSYGPDPYARTRRNTDAQSEVIEGDFEEIAPQGNPRPGSSGWTRH